MYYIIIWKKNEISVQNVEESFKYSTVSNLNEVHQIESFHLNIFHWNISRYKKVHDI